MNKKSCIFGVLLVSLSIIAMEPETKKANIESFLVRFTDQDEPMELSAAELQALQQSEVVMMLLRHPKNGIIELPISSLEYQLLALFIQIGADQESLFHEQTIDTLISIIHATTILSLDSLRDATIQALLTQLKEPHELEEFLKSYVDISADDDQKAIHLPPLITESILAGINKSAILQKIPPLYTTAMIPLTENRLTRNRPTFDKNLTKCAITQPNGKIEIFDIHSGKFTNISRNLSINSDSSITFSDSGNRAAIVDDANKIISILDIQSEAFVHTTISNQQYIKDIRFSQDDNYLAFTGEDNIIYIWDVRTQKSQLIQTIIPDEDLRSIFKLTILFHPTNKYLIGSIANQTRIWNIENGAPICKFNEECFWSKSCNYFAALSMNDINIWRLNMESNECDKKLFSRLQSKEQEGLGTFSPKDTYFYSGTLEKNNIWEIATGRLIHSFKRDKMSWFTEFNQNDNYLAYYLHSNMYIWDLKGNTLLFRIGINYFPQVGAFTDTLLKIGTYNAIVFYDLKPIIQLNVFLDDPANLLQALLMNAISTNATPLKLSNYPLLLTIFLQLPQDIQKVLLPFVILPTEPQKTESMVADTENQNRE